MTVDTEGGKSLLSVSGKHRCQIYCAGALGTVKTPDSLYGIGIHIHGFRTVAPAWGDGDSDIDTLSAEFIGASRRFGDTSDGCIGDYDLYGLAVCIFEVFGKKLRGASCHIHCLLLKGFSYFEYAPSAVDSRAYSDNGI